jgi:hypothetical protein
MEGTCDRPIAADGGGGLITFREESTPLCCARLLAVMVTTIAYCAGLIHPPAFDTQENMPLALRGVFVFLITGPSSRAHPV